MSCGTCGGSNPPGAGSATSSTGSARGSCNNCVTRVRIVNGENDDGRPILSESVNQFVNLPRERCFVDDVTGNLDRLGNRVKIWVEQELHTSITFEFRVVPTQTNAGYTQEERQANPQYVFRPSVWATASGGSYNSTYQNWGTEREVQIAAVGNEDYTIEVRCSACGNTVTCGPITALRRIWYFIAAMEDEGTPVNVPNLTRFKNYFRDDFGLIMRELPRQTISEFVYRGINRHEQRIRRSLGQPFEDSGGRGKPDHTMAFVFIDQIATKTEHIQRDNVTLTRGTPHTIDLPDYLWWDMGGPGGEWFVNNAVFFPTGHPDTDLPQSMFTPLPGARVPSRRNQLRLNVDAVFAEIESNTTGTVGSTVSGMLRTTVNVARGWCGGYTYPGYDYIVMATRSCWEDKEEGNIIQVMNHEFGHSLKMVPSDNRARSYGLDPVGTHYIERGHQGDHCFAGVSTALPTSGEYGSTHDGEARCNMYGRSGQATYRNIMRYCTNCTRSVKKVDMHNGWDRSA